MTNEFTKQFTEAADKMKQFVPQVNFNKNGYEIRAQMLEMAQQQLWQDYHARWGAFETSVTKDGKEVVTKVEMPTVPGVDKVLEAAQKFYDFVNQNTSKK
jgi:hypothetical protein